MEQIKGYVERIVYHNEDTGYTIARIQEPNKKELTTIVGSMPAIQPGETIRCEGTWKSHLIHGQQLEITSWRMEAPADLIGIEKYLGSGLINGIGPGYAKRIVEMFGIDTLEIIDKDPRQLEKVSGLGKKRLNKIVDCWSDQRSIRDVMIFLQSYGVSPKFAQKIYKIYGNKSIAKVKENPYSLAQDVIGIGFKSADTIAQKMGIATDAPERLSAGILYVMDELGSEGHTCFPIEELVPRAAQMLEVSLSKIEEQAQFLVPEEKLIVAEMKMGTLPQHYAWLPMLYRSEFGIARELIRIVSSSCQLRTVDTSKAIKWVEEKLKLELAENQKAAVQASLQDKVHIITGGPGTGKSTITNAILTISDQLTSHILLAAPTGRAAKRMSEITGRRAQTIHSLLEFDFRAGGFKRNHENPLHCDLIIIDESSMIDTVLMYQLLKAIPTACRVIFVGDIHQLPSVGPGNVLKDLIQSDLIKVTTLNQIFRQAAGSRIITNAHRINNGTFPEINSDGDSDFFFIESKDPERMVDEIVSLVTQRLPSKYNFNPLQDIQILSPMRKGLVGITNLNEVLQAKLNPEGKHQLPGGRRFLENDKVMQIKNNYQKDVYNGDVGYIVKISSADQEVIVQFDEREIEYTYAELDELVLAYAVSVHKFQGSETPCVIMPIHTTHYMMLHRNLVYTGVTRGKKIVVLIGTKRALWVAVHNDDVRNRHTGLKSALQALAVACK